MGHQEVGVMTSIKHFPGHGDTSQDSHKTLPEIRSNLKRLNEVELYPYKKLIDDNIVNSVMAAHILYPSLDKKNPSSISKTPALISTISLLFASSMNFFIVAEFG